jgi:hypothetical protein
MTVLIITARENHTINITERLNKALYKLTATCKKGMLAGTYKRRLSVAPSDFETDDAVSDSDENGSIKNISKTWGKKTERTTLSRSVDIAESARNSSEIDESGKEYDENDELQKIAYRKQKQCKVAGKHRRRLSSDADSECSNSSCDTEPYELQTAYRKQKQCKVAGKHRRRLSSDADSESSNSSYDTEP